MNTVNAFAPATIGNVSVGFDILGMAIEKPGDVVSIKTADHNEVRVIDVTGDDGRLPREASKNTAGIAVLELRKFLNTDRGFDITLHKHMPIGSGLGSSAASAAAAVWAANCVLDQPLTKEQLLPFAAEAEKFTSGSAHADNVAPSLLGGLVLIQSYDPLRVKQIPVPDNLYVSVVYPEIEILTSEARGVLPKEIPLSTGIRQWANVASFISACYEGNLKLMGDFLEDNIAEPHRGPLIAGFSEARRAAIANGATGCGISGSGPSIFSLSGSLEVAKKVGAAKQQVFKTLGKNSHSYVSPVNFDGAKVVE